MKRTLFILALAVMLFGTSSAIAQTCAPPWQIGISISTGEVLSFGGHNWKAIQPETQTVDGWQPPNTPALWSDMGPCTGGGGGTPTPTPAPTATPMPTATPKPTPTPTPGGGGGNCAPAWSASAVYTGGMMASLTINGQTFNYTAAYWTQGQNPATNNGGPGSGAPWQLPVSCSVGPTPTPTPTPKPTPTPTPGGGGGGNGSFIFASYKDVTINADFNTGMQRSAVTGTIQPVTSAMPNSTLVWAFATNSCDSESWAGISPSMEATNVQAFVNAGKKYILGTGGAAGSFSCSSGSGLIGFINRYNSSNLVGVDFDIESGQSQQDIDNLINATKAAEQQFPKLQFSFTIPSLGSLQANPITGGSVGTTVVNEIKRLGLGGNFVVNLMAMDYGSTGGGNCVVVGSRCDMGQSAVQAAQALNQQSGISFSHIGVTVMIGQNDTQDEVTAVSDVDTLSNFAKSSGLATVRFWAFDRDTPNGNGGLDTMNGNGAPPLAYSNEFLKFFQ